MNDLKRRSIDLTCRHRLTHLSSVLNVIDTIDHIYSVRQPNDPFILGPSHGALGLYVVLEKHGLCDAEEMISKHGTHAGRDMENGIWVSGGSLGQAETVAVGFALADRSRQVYMVTSDGALAEGCVWEALRLIDELNLSNMNIYAILNGLGGYGTIDLHKLKRRVLSFCPLVNFVEPEPFPWPWMQGLNGHYTTITREQAEVMCEV